MQVNTSNQETKKEVEKLVESNTRKFKSKQEFEEHVRETLGISSKELQAVNSAPEGLRIPYHLFYKTMRLEGIVMGKIDEIQRRHAFLLGLQFRTTKEE